MDVRVFEFEDYKEYLLRAIAHCGKRGICARLAHHMRADRSLLSHVLNSSRHLNPEQAVLAADFLKLDERETEYFLLLVEFSRSGSEMLRLIKRRQLASMRIATGT